MENIIRDAFREIPRYVSDSYQAIRDPHGLAKRQLPATQDVVSQALIFVGISVIITLILRLPQLGRSHGTFLDLASYGVWALATLLVMTLILTITWRTVGGRWTFQDFFPVNSYFFSTFMVLGHLISLISFSAGLATTSFSTSLLIAGVLFLPIVYWCIAVWRAYTELNKVTGVRAAAALIITLVVAAPTVFLLGNIQSSLLGTTRAAFYPFLPIHP